MPIEGFLIKGAVQDFSYEASQHPELQRSVEDVLEDELKVRLIMANRNGTEIAQTVGSTVLIFGTATYYRQGTRIFVDFPNAAPVTEAEA